MRELLSVFGDEEHSHGVLCADVMLDEGTNPAARADALERVPAFLSRYLAR